MSDLYAQAMEWLDYFQQAFRDAVEWLSDPRHLVVAAFVTMVALMVVYPLTQKKWLRRLLDWLQFWKPKTRIPERPLDEGEGAEPEPESELEETEEDEPTEPQYDFSWLELSAERSPTFPSRELHYFNQLQERELDGRREALGHRERMMEVRQGNMEVFRGRTELDADRRQIQLEQDRLRFLRQRLAEAEGRGVETEYDPDYAEERKEADLLQKHLRNRYLQERIRNEVVKNYFSKRNFELWREVQEAKEMQDDSPPDPYIR